MWLLEHLASKKQLQIMILKYIAITCSMNKAQYLLKTDIL